MSDEPVFPHGKKFPDDEGELAIRIASDPEHDVVRIDFGKPVQWMALEPTEALELATLIVQHAIQLPSMKANLPGKEA